MQIVEPPLPLKKLAAGRCRPSLKNVPVGERLYPCPLPWRKRTVLEGVYKVGVERCRYCMARLVWKHSSIILVVGRCRQFAVSAPSMRHHVVRHIGRRFPPLDMGHALHHALAVLHGCVIVNFVRALAHERLVLVLWWPGIFHHRLTSPCVYVWQVGYGIPQRGAPL